MTVEQRLEDLAALDALGILPDEDLARYQELLAEAGTAAVEEAHLFHEATVLIAESLEPVAPPADIKAKVMGAIRTRRKLDESLPVRCTTVRAEEGRWVDLPVPGVRVKKLGVDKEHDTVTFMLRLEPGSILPAHDHHGSEQSYVIAGSCRIGAVHLAEGDYHRVEEGEHHGDVVSDEGCTLLLVVDREDYEAA